MEDWNKKVTKKKLFRGPIMAAALAMSPVAEAAAQDTTSIPHNSNEVVGKTPESEIDKILHLQSLAESSPDKVNDIQEALSVEEFLAFKSSGKSSGKEGDYPDSPLQTLLTDNTLIGINKTAALIPRLESESKSAYVERVVYAQRYLSFRQLPVTTENIAVAVSAGAETRARWGKHELFSGTTLFAASTDEPTFYESLVNDFERKSDHFEIIDGESIAGLSIKSQHEARRELYEKIRTTKGKLNIVFMMHGLPDGVLLEHAEETADGIGILIDAQHITDAFEKRYLNAADRERAKIDPDVLVFASCFSGSFIMDLQNKMRAKHLPLPIIIAATEAGQESSYEEGRGSYFLQKIISKPIPKVSDLYDSDTWDIDSNPIVLAPDTTTEGLPVQVATNADKSLGKNVSAKL